MALIGVMNWLEGLTVPQIPHLYDNDSPGFVG